ncbi:MAG: hypothetical protein ACLVAH_04735 [Anaeromassilibacillus sp.]
MKIEDQLKSIILSKYKSVRAFTTDINIPYSTLDSVFRRGIGKAGIETMIKVFNALNLDIESISTGVLKEKASPTSEEPEAGEVIEGPMSKEFDLFYKFLVSRGFNSDHLTDLQRSILASVADILDAVFPSSETKENDRSGMSG